MKFGGLSLGILLVAAALVGAGCGNDESSKSSTAQSSPATEEATSETGKQADDPKREKQTGKKKSDDSSTTAPLPVKPEISGPAPPKAPSSRVDKDGKPFIPRSEGIPKDIRDGVISA
ncbi:MAG: hypothetical protein ACPHCI_07315, partial [Solirubrobacterales bacterium]